MKPRTIFLALITVLTLPAALFAASFHWVDREGFHSADQITKVPLGHRLDLSMVKNKTSLPFTEQEDRDGAMFVWYALNQAGYKAPYTKASEIPKSPFYFKVRQPQAGNIACWKKYIAIVSKSDLNILTAQGEKSRRSLEKKNGKTAWYQFNEQIQNTIPRATRTAPDGALKSADKWLLRLDSIAVYPLDVKDQIEIVRLKNEWKQAVSYLEELCKKYPDDPQITRRLGVIYRRGFTLQMPGAWERAEAYLLRTTTLAPKSAEAFISLGILYGDTDKGLEKQAEFQFNQALKLANKNQLPHIWWGLSMSLFKQGKYKESLDAVDQLIKLLPTDKSAKNLRITILEKERTHPGSNRTH